MVAEYKLRGDSLIADQPRLCPRAAGVLVESRACRVIRSARHTRIWCVERACNRLAAKAAAHPEGFHESDIGNDADCGPMLADVTLAANKKCHKQDRNRS
jgi:hypothetical protein